MYQSVKSAAAVTTIRVVLCGALLCAAVPALAQMPGGGGPPPGGIPSAKASASNAFQAAFQRWDINHDGAVTCDEWRAYATRLFNTADKNRDGFLDAPEFRQIGQLEPILADADLSYFDENHDKRVSRQEFVDNPSQLFARYDTNHDCRVTTAEIDGQKPSAPPPQGRGGRGGGHR